MKKLVACAIAAAALTAFADRASFPYDTSMETRIETNKTVEVSSSTVSLTGTTTPTTDTVADLVMTGVVFTAIGADDWEDFVSGLSGAAMLTVSNNNETYTWCGYTNGAWVALDNGPVCNTNNVYDVRISFDKTPGSNKIRYSAKVHGAADYTDFKVGGNAWLAQGNSATQLQAVDLKGTGSADYAKLSSGARAAYAEISGVDQTYSFDYSNVVFSVAFGDDTIYGSNAKVKISLKNGDTVVSSKEVTAEVNKTNEVAFTNLTPGSAYDCVVEVVADSVPTSTVTQAASGVKLYASADWFGFANGVFTNVGYTNNVLIVDGSFTAEDEDSPVVVTPSVASSDNSKSTVDVLVDYTNFAETNEYGDAQSALALTSDGWMCCDDGEWTAITNKNVSAESGTYWTRAEFDYTVNPGKVRFSVKEENGDTWYVMKNGATEWFELNGTSNRLNGTSFSGSGKINQIAASYNATGTIQPTVSDGTITLKGSTEADLSKIAVGEYTVQSADGKKYNMKWKDSDGKFAKVENGKLVVKGGTPANGLDSYNSFALGLDAETASSKPVLDSAQNASNTQLTFKVPNVVPNTDYAEVTMKVLTLDSPSATSDDGIALPAGGSVNIDLPNDGSVKYYKVKISIKTK